MIEPELPAEHVVDRETVRFSPSLTCAVERRVTLVGANPTQQLSTCRQPDYAAFMARGIESPGFFAGIIGIITSGPDLHSFYAEALVESVFGS